MPRFTFYFQEQRRNKLKLKKVNVINVTSSLKPILLILMDYADHVRWKCVQSVENTIQQTKEVIKYNFYIITMIVLTKKV